MIQNEVLKFDINNMELIEEVSNSQFAKVKVYCFASGENSHRLPVRLSALKLAEPSILQKPLTFAYDARKDDASTHSPSQIPCGFVPKDTKITYELSDDGRVFCCVEALIWKFYSGRIMEIFKKADGEKQVSVEIIPIEFETQKDGSREIVAFAYRCITILGEAYTSAVKDAKAEIIEFSKAKEEYDQQVFATDTSIKSLDNDDSNEDINIALKNESKEDEGMKDKEKIADDEIPKEEKMAEVEVEKEEPKSPDGEVDCAKVACEKCDKMECECQKDMSADSVDYKVKCEEMETKFSTLESENADIVTKFAALETEMETIKNENVSLKEFKSNVEKSTRDNEIEFAIREVSEDIGQSNIDTWKLKAGEYESVEAFSNAIKSFAYGLTKGKKGKKEDFNRIALVGNSDAVEGSQDCWSKLKNQLTK